MKIKSRRPGRRIRIVMRGCSITVPASEVRDFERTEQELMRQDWKHNRVN